MNSSFSLIINLVASIFIMGSLNAHADTSNTASTILPEISDNANLFSAEQTEKIQQFIERARNDGSIAATVVTETATIRLTAHQRANELNSEYRDQWAKAHPNEQLADEIDLQSIEGPKRSKEMKPLPLTFYFARAAPNGQEIIAVGGIDVMTSEIGIPETTAIYNDTITRFVNGLKKGKDPAQAFTDAIESFLNALASHRAEIYRDDKTGSNSGIPSIILIGIGLLFTAALAFGLRKLSGQGREAIVECTLPRLPLKTRLGGRHSGGMTASLNWTKPSKSAPSDDVAQ